jgi:molecular chaperone HtpG
VILNAKHPLVKYIMEHEEGKLSKMIGRQLYDLAQIQNAPLSPDDMAGFVTRSNEIMMMLMKQEDGSEEKSEGKTENGSEE